MLEGKDSVDLNPIVPLESSVTNTSEPRYADFIGLLEGLNEILS